MLPFVISWRREEEFSGKRRYEINITQLCTVRTVLNISRTVINHCLFLKGMLFHETNGLEIGKQFSESSKYFSTH